MYMYAGSIPYQDFPPSYKRTKYAYLIWRQPIFYDQYPMPLHGTTEAPSGHLPSDPYTDLPANWWHGIIAAARQTLNNV